MVPDARVDWLFLTLVAAICLYDPNSSELSNQELVSQEQRTFYRILLKLIKTKMGHRSAFSDNESSLQVQLEKRIFSRLNFIQHLFENLILYSDPGEQIKLISKEFDRTIERTLYKLPITSTATGTTDSSVASTSFALDPTH